ncbi:MAG: hypothetical protein OEW08_11745 [Gammaproteobacteria bacterium]|nr:hypothetical protein [Gammaproteobacteria bacterium]
MPIFNFKRREAVTAPVNLGDDEVDIGTVGIPDDTYAAHRAHAANDEKPVRAKEKRSGSKLGWLLMLSAIAGTAIWDRETTAQHEQEINQKMNALDALISPTAKEVDELTDKISTLQQSNQTLQNQVAALASIPTMFDALRETQTITTSNVGQIDERLKRIEFVSKRRAEEQAVVQQRQVIAEQQRATEVASKPEFPHKIFGVDSWGGTPLVSVAGPNNAPLLLRVGQSVGEWTVIKIEMTTRKVTLRHASGYVYTTVAN